MTSHRTWFGFFASVVVVASALAAERQPVAGVEMLGPDGVIYPDFTAAGIKGGIPEMKEGQWKVFNVADHGAGPADDGKDDTAAIQAAINAAATIKGGIVFLPEGHYQISTRDKKPALWLSRGKDNNVANVVLRGAGRRKTTIHLADAPGDAPAIGLIGHGKTTHLTPMLARDARRGDTSIYVAAADKKLFPVGTRINIVANAANEPDYYRGKAYMTLNPEGMGYYNPYARSLNEVAAIADEGDAVKLSLRQPLRFDLKTGQGDYWLPGNNKQRRNHTDVIPRVMLERAGLEEFTLTFSEKARAVGSSQSYGANGILFKNAYECWLRGVEIVRPGRFPIVTEDVKFLHYYDVQLREIEHRYRGGGTGYGGWFDMTGNYFVEDCLMDYVEMQDMRHAPVLQGHTTGCVIRNSRFYAGKHDYHSGLTAETLVETSLQDLRGGGGEAFRSPQLPGDLHYHAGPGNVTFNCDFFTPKQGLYVGGQNVDWVFAYNRVYAEAGFRGKPDQHPMSMILFFDWIDGFVFKGNVFISPNIAGAPAIHYLPGYKPGSGWREGDYCNSDLLTHSRNIVFDGNAFYGWTREEIFKDPGFDAPRAVKHNAFNRESPPHNRDFFEKNTVHKDLPHGDVAELRSWPNVGSWPKSKPFAASLYAWQYKAKHGVEPWSPPAPAPGPWTQPVKKVAERIVVNPETIRLPYHAQNLAIDGKTDPIWEKIPTSNAISKAAGDKVPDPADLSGEFKAFWTQHALHLLITARDERPNADSGSQWWHDDGVELYIDADDAKSASYDDNDNQIGLLPFRKEYFKQKGPALGDLFVDYIEQPGGYAMEVVIPWESIGFGGLSDLKAAAGSKIGLNLVLVDDDKGGNRDTRLSWINDYDAKGNDGSHHNPSLFGTAELQGDVDPSLAKPPYMTQATAAR